MSAASRRAVAHWTLGQSSEALAAFASAPPAVLQELDLRPFARQAKDPSINQRFYYGSL